MFLLNMVGPAVTVRFSFCSLPKNPEIIRGAMMVDVSNTGNNRSEKRALL